MGRWAESEFDRVLIDKIKVLFNSCRDPLLESSTVDLRFRTFVRTLDPNDKAIQACFRSLIQQSHLSTARARASNRRPISDYLTSMGSSGLSNSISDPIFSEIEDISPEASSRSRSPPPRQRTRIIRTRRLVPRDDLRAPSSPGLDELYAEARGLEAESDAIQSRFDELAALNPTLRPRTDSPTLLGGTMIRGEYISRPPRIRPPTYLRPRPESSASSRPHSPSRMRRLGLDPSAATFVPGAAAREPSPPSAASRAWLDEYAPTPESLLGDNDDDVAERDEPYFYRPAPIRRPTMRGPEFAALTAAGRQRREEMGVELNAPDSTLGAARRRRREEMEADPDREEREEMGTRRRRRRLDDQAADVDAEVEAMFGSWTHDDDDDVLQPSLQQPEDRGGGVHGAMQRAMERSLREYSRRVPGAYPGAAGGMDTAGSSGSETFGATADRRDTRRDGVVLEVPPSHEGRW